MTDTDTRTWALGAHWQQYFNSASEDPAEILEAMLGFVKEARAQGQSFERLSITVDVDDEHCIYHYGTVELCFPGRKGDANVVSDRILQALAERNKPSVEEHDCSQCTNASFTQGGDVRCAVLNNEIVWDTSWAQRCSMFTELPDAPVELVR